MNITWLKTPTGKRQSSWLFSNVAEELNSGLPRTTPATTPAAGPVETNNVTNNVNEHNMVKNPNWQEAIQLAIYKRGRGVEPGTTANNTSD